MAYVGRMCARLNSEGRGDILRRYPLFNKQKSFARFTLHNLCQLIMNQSNQLYFLLFMLLGIYSMPAAAQYRSLGIGGMIGSPTGISLKKWVSRRAAYDFGAAWSIGKNPGAHLHADYLLHRSDLEGLESGRSFAYYGIGGRLKLVDADPRAGARFPLGITYLNPEEPFDVFLEIVPIFDILPSTRFAMNISLGGRIYLSGNRNRY